MADTVLGDMQEGIVGEPVTPSSRAHIDELLRLTERLEASDIHLKAGRPPILRIDGELRPQTAYEPLTDADTERLFGQISSPSQPGWNVISRKPWMNRRNEKLSSRELLS